MTNITVISRTAILALALSSILFAAGCDPATDKTPTAPSPSPAAAAPTVAPVEKAPASNASPVASPSPAASPAAPTKTKTPK
ncbi:MAG TPA: hypothetical protein VNO50_15475 [Pyrinomonadaceae bacterium]|nr:hypothetical protein [Pyrinomonadaceae bacterium]